VSTLELHACHPKDQCHPWLDTDQPRNQERTKLAVLTDGESVLMKPLEALNWRRSSADRRDRAFARRAGLKKADVSKAIRSVRNANRSRRNVLASVYSGGHPSRA